jgi:hypothetical protein
MGAQPNSPLTVNLAHETLELWICGICKAITAKEDRQFHIDWHDALVNTMAMVAHGNP